MNNVERAARNIIQRHLAWGVKEEDYLDEVVIALADAGLLTPDPQIIRTLDEIDALDPDTVLMLMHGGISFASVIIAVSNLGSNEEGSLPAVVVATGAQVRAARTALQEATE